MYTPFVNVVNRRFSFYTLFILEGVASGRRYGRGIAQLSAIRVLGNE